MKTLDIISKMNNIEAMCKIALKHASSLAKSEVVGHYSGRTLEEMLLGIKALCEEAKDELVAELTGMEA